MHVVNLYKEINVYTKKKCGQVNFQFGQVKITGTLTCPTG